MPAASRKQYKFMQGVAHGNIPATGGMTKDRAREVAMSTSKGLRSRFAKKKQTVKSNAKKLKY